ncbi:peptidylprolyl isomerase [Stigmatella aurantiaca]|uniref:Peptidyl-prolyl cis-trans isomerase n=1 Tax=Stigmatella aurantiaca (strain DW4/3-1) TaxID=378806 RepID=Q09CE4_STIAD|nr:peptidylprolyl isomerase [Stigmatella aurantiaca]ADO69594.1 Peptidyl-prolyl cis-trans isomerase [Stigmatella aurantiaca DW4/3-1]EAU69412.1 peptidyl-prolyl cis-trans isomerase B [Stigmatella aurantiaca DW4/3-1]
MRTRLLTFGLLLAFTACEKEAPAAKPPAPPPPPAAAVPTPPPPPTANPQEAADKAHAEKVAAAAATATGWQKAALEGKELFAVMDTSEGKIILRLFSKDAPLTVANFVGLASGQKEWQDPSNLQKTHRPLYDGTKFHRVITNFMIQGGDPLGNGTGRPGYTFEDEFQSGRKFDKTGLLAMANAGPGTNGSQFFITTSTPQWLNNRHTIFGEVIEGYNVVEKISNVQKDPRDRPLKDVVVKKVTISDKKP